MFTPHAAAVVVVAANPPSYICVQYEQVYYCVRISEYCTRSQQAVLSAGVVGRILVGGCWV